MIGGMYSVELAENYRERVALWSTFRDGRIDTNSDGKVSFVESQRAFREPCCDVDIATFDQDTWYYITQKTQNFAFFKPEIIDQQVLVVNFDDRDMVSGVNHYTIEDGLIVDPVSRKTPTVGKELTILQQLFGNVGRFAK